MMVDGLYHKYVVAKRDGSSIDPKALYLVLRLDTDSCARGAALMYADCIKPKWPGLAENLCTLVGSLSIPPAGE